MEKPTLGAHIPINQPYEAAVEKAKAALKAEGFGVLTEIDVKATMKQKLNADFRRYVILGACNPPLAHRALSADLEVGLLLPCNVCVYETDDAHSAASIVSPQGMASMLSNPAFDSIAAEAQAKLDRVAKALAE